MTEKSLKNLIPNPSTRSWLREIWQQSPEWSAALAGLIVNGEAEDMGSVDLFAPCPNHQGRNVAYRECPLCGAPKARLESCRAINKRWDETPPAEPNPRQLSMGEKTQLKMEV